MNFNGESPCTELKYSKSSRINMQDTETSGINLNKLGNSGTGITIAGK